MTPGTVVADLVQVFIDRKNVALTLKSVGYYLRRHRHIGDPSIRCQLQRHCARCSQFQGKEDLFYNPVPGVWRLRPEVYERMLADAASPTPQQA